MGMDLWPLCVLRTIQRTSQFLHHLVQTSFARLLPFQFKKSVKKTLLDTS